MEKQYKRTSRSVKPEVRTKIANTIRGVKKSESTKAAISNGMKKYWSDDRVISLMIFDMKGQVMDGLKVVILSNEEGSQFGSLDSYLIFSNSAMSLT